MTNITDKLNSVQTKEDLSIFVQALVLQLRDEPGTWENRDLASFLEAMAGWITDMDGYYCNSGQPFDGSASWRNFADILIASRNYS